MLALTTETVMKAPESGLNALSETIYQSNFIKKHFDFYQWQQQHVNKFIPHNVLIAAWGDFNQGNLEFDVCSSIPEIHNQQYTNGCDELKPLMTALFSKWEKNNDRWFFMEEFKLRDLGLEASSSDKIMTELLPMRSVLVYGFRDKRTNTNIVYAFLNSHLMYETQTSTLSAIMPHLDAALRRVDCLPAAQNVPESTTSILKRISEREFAVLELVAQGKTNTVIAAELFISVNTVKNHLKNIFKKMKVTSRAQAVAEYLNEATPLGVSASMNNVHMLSVAS